MKVDEHFMVASAADAPAIAALVNAAYRPLPGAAGWTHESELVAGPRIDAAQLVETMQTPGSVILVAKTLARIDACVHLQKRDGVCLLGLLAVDPGRQCTGLGKRLLDYAERLAGETWACSTIRMSVIAQRPELLAFYQRRGYRSTGAMTPYPVRAGVGSPIVDGMTVMTLEKPVLPAIPR